MRNVLISLAAAAVTFVAAQSAHADAHANPAQKTTPGWKEFKSDEFGFKMEVPKLMRLTAAANKDGWGGLRGRLHPVEIVGIAKLGEKHKPLAIEQFGIKVSGIPRRYWKGFAAGKNQQGFEWYRAAVTERGNQVMVAIYGVGAKGSYLIFVKTTKTHYKKHKAAYDHWVKTITLY